MLICWEWRIIFYLLKILEINQDHKYLFFKLSKIIFYNSILYPWILFYSIKYYNKKYTSLNKNIYIRFIIKVKFSILNK